MTFANKITVGRIFLVPVFAVLAIYYGMSVEEGRPKEMFRWAALSVFIIASVTDGLDGWIARRFQQMSELGAIIDPLADKLLLLTGLITLSFVDWGPDDWHIPLWFSALVIFRDFIILGGTALLHFTNRSLKLKPHWSGKVCTFTQMIALGWVMLKLTAVDLIYPCALAAFFTTWSGYVYLRRGLRRLREDPDPLQKS